MDSRGSPARRWLAPLLKIPTPAVFVAAAAIATVLLWRQGALTEIGGSLKAASPWYVLVILLVYAASILALGLRWHALVRMTGGSPPWAESVGVFLTSVIVNYAAPIGLAVPTRAALTVRDLKLSAGQSGAVVAWEAGLDTSALAIISVVWLVGGGAALVETVTMDARAPLVVAGLIVVVAVAAIGLLRTSRYWTRVTGFVGRGLGFAQQQPGLALAAAVLTAGYWAVQLAVMAALLQLLGTPPTPSLVLGLMGLPVLIGMFSPVPGGAGVREGLMAAVARLEGTAAGPVILAAVAYRLALFVVTPLIWGAVRATRVRFH